RRADCAVLNGCVTRPLRVQLRHAPPRAHRADGEESDMGGLDGVATLIHLVRGGEVAETRKTPHTVIADGPHRRVLRYGDDAARAAARDGARPPVLLIPPLAVSTDCYDLTPGLSLVEHL